VHGRFDIDIGFYRLILSHLILFLTNLYLYLDIW